MTFSIVARSPDALLFGVAVVSSSPAVAARCIYAKAGVGAVATQSLTDPSLGPRILQSLADGATAAIALADALSSTAHGAYRQLLVLGARGQPAIHTGTHALGVVGSAISANAAAAGNLLARPDVPSAMTDAFESATGQFGTRLLRSLRAALGRGGEAGATHSAGLLIVRDVSWPIVDLRVDWTEDDPVSALELIWSIYAPQVDDYVRRALDPGRAPKFGVPGDA